MIFKPARHLFFVEDRQLRVIPPELIEVSEVGEKAYGLCAIPGLWTPPFFVISQKLFEEYSHRPQKECIESYISVLQKAALEVGISAEDKIIVRSSSPIEGIHDRGRYYSKDGNFSNISDIICKCFDAFIADCNIPRSPLPFLVQKFISPVREKGHLSNELRCSKEARDWSIETEISKDIYNINLRNWRSSKNTTQHGLNKLQCLSDDDLPNALKIPADFFYQQKHRVHVEWVWDGRVLYVVQADRESDTDLGVDPQKLLLELPQPPIGFSPQCLSIVTQYHAQQYNKIGNVYLYESLGIKLPNFYILNDKELLNSLQRGIIPNGLSEDLEELVKCSLVIRLDVKTNDLKIKQLLPRTNELRNAFDALNWMIEICKNSSDLFNYDLAFIFHNFVPATSSAFAYAIPGERQVIIQALWGLPEGLYYNAHDTYLIDTKHADTEKIIANADKFEVKSKANYKKYFVFPEKDGKWSVQNLSRKMAWPLTIKKTDPMLSQIAVISRKIADAVGKPLSIMWFTGVNKKVNDLGVLPWHHEEYDITTLSDRRFRKKTLYDIGITIQTKQDFENLQEDISSGKIKNIRYIQLQPTEEELHRDKDIVKAIGEIAKKIGAVIYLEGAILTHIYYQLVQTGAAIETSEQFPRSDSPAKFFKLVRDKIPEKIEAGGEIALRMSATENNILIFLKDKLIEESFELIDAYELHNTTEEIADLLEVIDSMMKRMGISKKAVDDIRRQKILKSGKFDDGVILLQTDNPLPKADKGMSTGQLKLEINSSKQSHRIEKSDILKDISSIKKWSDTKITPNATEHLLDIEVPLFLEEWAEKSAVIKLPDGDLDIRTFVTGQRAGAKLKIRFSLAIIPRQLKLP